jgi:2,3-bisphosphoglycerate-independent phosphoglycerate mutase
MVKVDQKAVLIVIDGWGVPPEVESGDYRKDGDAILAADTPIMDEMKKDGSKIAQGYTELEASSTAVGLPEGLMGNSEVGHLNIGAGRIVWQDVVRIDKTIKDKKMNQVENIKKSFQRAKDGTGRLHLLGLVSDGGVHSHNTHLYSLLEVAKEIGVPHVYIHCFGDGRDTDPKSLAGGPNYLQQLLDETKKIGIGEIATVVGRYFIMDRDKRWQRVEIGMTALIDAKAGEESSNPVKTIQERYEKGEDDEFLKPIIVGGDETRVKDDDTLFFFNYRSDRVREVTQLLGDYDRSPLPDFPYPKNMHITTMTQYKTDYKFPIAFAPQHMGNVLAEWLGKKELKQCHVAETEKYAHVTFFFNGGVEKQFEGEERELIPSPKVATYDKEPPMSAMKVADKLNERMSSGKFEFLMNNFAPPDMVGHTGVYEAAIVGVATTDKAIGTVLETCKKEGYVLFVTADHG